MILKKSRKLTAETTQADIDAFASLEKVLNYKPAADELSLVNLDRVLTELNALRAARVQARNAYRSVGDDAKCCEIEFHNLMTRVKKHMLAQFGEDSNEAQALGLKKQSEHRTTGRQKTEASTPS